jgi:hypothetical protein
MACHGGKMDRTTFTGNVVVIGSTYLPFDVQSFGYSGTAGFALGDQQEALRKLNQIVIESRPNEIIVSPTSASVINANHPVVRFIFSLYPPGSGGVNVAGNTASAAPTPSGWQGHDTTYQFVTKPYCQMCHMALDNTLDFTSYTNFSSVSGRIDAAVCSGPGRPMPHAQVPFEKFWKTTTPDAPAEIAGAGISINSCSP